MPELMLTTERVRPSTDYLAVETTPESSVLTWSTGKKGQHTGNPTVATTPESPMLTWSTGKKGQHTGNPTVETTPESPVLTWSTGKKGQRTGNPTVETTPESTMLTLSTGKTQQHTGYPTVETTPESTMLTLSTGKTQQHTGNPTVETTTKTWLGITSTGTNDSGGGAAREMNPEGSVQGLTIILPAVTGVILLCGRKIQTSPVGEENGDPSSTQKDKNDNRENPQEEEGCSETPYVPPATGAIPIPPTLKQFSTNPSHSSSDKLQSKDTDSLHEDQFGKAGEHTVSDNRRHVSATGGATVPHDLPPVSRPFDQTDQNIPQRLPARLPPLKRE
ncbi:probable GPI-anchored adhesin-like protein PGA18 [Lingula anatina]|uniref:Probable GPI-anchored adhesin-like protein PGA18 n=1 Tax=Lingula anatina TaxID=7574 RepID=A0A1S3H2T4_LINAN|nr:probable GPI-anchored adhesin-like protein PGA18 [Lingula anatina]|eukprot:XP_013380440.1 probable GPI-anchored adhesin-like protein PGA18 [Lingula anatina]